VSPMFSSISHEGNRERLAGLYEYAGRWIFHIQVAAVAFLALCGPEILDIFGKEYRAGADVLNVLLASQLVVAAGGAAVILLIMSGRSGVAFANSGAGVVLNLGLNLWLIPLYGIMGAAISTAVTRTMINIAQLIEVRIYHGVTPFSLRYVGPTAFVVVSTVIVYLVREAVPLMKGGVSGLASTALVFGILAAAGMKFTAPPDEIQEIIGMFRRKENV